jgi:hypothetical protein
MSHVIGKGRYARETYPKASESVGSAIIQTGFDQVETGSDEDIVIIPDGSEFFFPRNLALDPLRVSLANVTPGNYLEVDFRACLEKNDSYYYEQGEVNLLFLVSFDGTPPVLAPSPSVYIMRSGYTSHRDLSVTAEEDDQPVFNLTGLVSAAIPDGATTAIVQVVAGTAGGFLVSGDELRSQKLFATLKVSELNASRVTQPGPGALVATG